jgi:hypothetical protein
MFKRSQKLLMIAFHFPPENGIGAQRTKSFCKYLPDYGYEPIVLTVDKRVHLKSEEAHCDIFPFPVKRSFAFDSARALSIGGRYPSLTAIPDRWSSWWFSAVLKGLHIIRSYKPRAIWSTSPIATAHMIGATLGHFSGLPWIADFRDPMVDGRDFFCISQRKFVQWLEAITIHRASLCIFATTWQKDRIVLKYGDDVKARMHVIENGYDDEEFKHLSTRTSLPQNESVNTLLHSGWLYSNGRNPLPFFDAVQYLSRQGFLHNREFRVVFRGSGHDLLYEQEIKQRNIQNIVRLEPAISRELALREMKQAQGLLIFQGSKFNSQIPGKLYEYFALQKPILGVVNAGGATAQALSNYPASIVADDHDPMAIADALRRFIEQFKLLAGQAVDFNPSLLTRRARTHEFVAMLKRL